MRLRWFLLCLVPLLLVSIAPVAIRAQTQPAREPIWPAEPFRIQWQRTEPLVARGGAGYSWYWGPAPLGAPLLERDDETPGRRRMVLYFDKGRMELPIGLAGARTADGVSFGRLVAEMVTGNLQLGERRYDAGPPARIPVAGNLDDPLAPTYAAFARVVEPVAPAPGAVPGVAIDRSGALTPRPDLAQAFPETRHAAYDDITGHNIPRVFTTFLAQRGTVDTPRGRRAEQVIDPLAVVGRPISEAYWADITVGGVVRPVLVQLFERRALTYNPANPARFRVEFGNAGLHYLLWRYGQYGPRQSRQEELLSHFELGDQALNGNFWFSFDDRPDGGTSRAVNRLIGPGVGDSLRAMRFEYELTTAIPFAFASLSVNLDQGGAPRDLRPYSAIGFWARGDGRPYSAQLASALADQPFTITFTPGGDWSWVELPLAAFTQFPEAASLSSSGGLATATRLSFRPVERPAAGFLDIDDLVLIRGDAAPPPAPGPTPLTDFESGSLTTLVGTDWFTYTDQSEGGGSTAQLEVVPAGQGGSGSALRLRGGINSQWGVEPFAGIGVRLAPTGQTIDLCDYQAVQLSVRTDGNHYRLQLNSPLVSDGNQYGIVIAAPTRWTTLAMPIKRMTPLDPAADPLPWSVVCTQIESLIITPINKPPAFQLLLDDVALAR